MSSLSCASICRSGRAARALRSLAKAANGPGVDSIVLGATQHQKSKVMAAQEELLPDRADIPRSVFVKDALEFSSVLRLSERDS